MYECDTIPTDPRLLVECIRGGFRDCAIGGHSSSCASSLGICVFYLLIVLDPDIGHTDCPGRSRFHRDT